MRAIEVLKLDSISSNYYECNLCKSSLDIEMNFGDGKVIFDGYLIMKCGYPNEEVYLHYDYYTQDSMRKFILYEMLDSEWINKINEMNKVHPKHSNEISKSDKHYIILFEDEVFECIAKSFRTTV